MAGSAKRTAPMPGFHTLDQADVKGKRVLIRADLNVPMEAGRVTDDTRIRAVVPTVRSVIERGGEAILLSHFGRPKGPDPSQSLAPVAPVVAGILGKPVAFAKDCVGPVAEKAVAAMKPGEVLLLENTRFHADEEKNAPQFVTDTGHSAWKGADVPEDKKNYKDYTHDIYLWTIPLKRAKASADAGARPKKP